MSGGFGLEAQPLGGMLAGELAMKTLSNQTLSTASPEHRRAFTLTDLLVVVGILAILGLVLLPAMATTAERS